MELKEINKELTFYNGYLMYLKVEDPYFKTALKRYDYLKEKQKELNEKTRRRSIW